MTEAQPQATDAASARAGTTMRLEGLSVARGGRTVVSEVSLEIPPGEVTALLGPNGAGKSSLVLAVAGVLRPTGGRVLLSGGPVSRKKTSANGVVSVEERDLTRRRPEQIRAAGVAIVAEGRRLLPELTFEENLRVATYSLSREESASGIKYALGENPYDTVRVENGVLEICYDKWPAFDNQFGHVFYKDPFSYYVLAAEYRFVGEQVPSTRKDLQWAVRNNGLMIQSPAPRTMVKDRTSRSRSRCSCSAA